MKPDYLFYCYGDVFHKILGIFMLLVDRNNDLPEYCKQNEPLKFETSLFDSDCIFP